MASAIGKDTHVGTLSAEKGESQGGKGVNQNRKPMGK